MEKKKRFDAVRMVPQIRDTHYEQTKHMTKEERLAFYQEKGKQAQADLERLAELVGTNKIDRDLI
ncbi:MAG: hypothetical protein GKR89_31495 [Candidatus Latescibacteria bacterium]|nr:hypothetical protein [Candidatus Latescibacterota bacterium]